LPAYTTLSLKLPAPAVLASIADRAAEESCIKNWLVEVDQITVSIAGILAWHGSFGATSTLVLSDGGLEID
jgi:hypothetical protein